MVLRDRAGAQRHPSRDSPRQRDSIYRWSSPSRGSPSCDSPSRISPSQDYVPERTPIAAVIEASRQYAQQRQRGGCSSCNRRRRGHRHHDHHYRSRYRQYKSHCQYTPAPRATTSGGRSPGDGGPRADYCSPSSARPKTSVTREWPRAAEGRCFYGTPVTPILNTGRELDGTSGGVGFSLKAPYYNFVSCARLPPVVRPAVNDTAGVEDRVIRPPRRRPLKGEIACTLVHGSQGSQRYAPLF